MSKRRWGVIGDDGKWRSIPMEPLRGAGWVAPYFWVARPDGKVLWIVPEPEPEVAGGN